MSAGNKADDNARLMQGERLPDPEEGARTIELAADDEWPAPADEAAYHGVAGRVVATLDPHTESDPIAILVQLLASFGNAIGRGPYFPHEAARHYPCMNVVLVGQSSKARKGTSWQHVWSLFSNADSEWARRRILSGLSSGEGLIGAVRDPRYEKRPLREDKKITGYEDVLADEGESDKRLLVLEPEFARVLQVASRDGSTLSAVIREAWDSGNLHVMTKSPVVATSAHISIVGHITRDELLRYLSRTESANGFANRFLWVLARRSKLLPEGGNFSKIDVSGFVRDLKAALEFSRKLGETEVVRDQDARALWCRVYPSLTADRPGMAGAVLGRSEAQVARLSLIYALLDRSGQIKEEHLRAALALWEYVERSVAFVFGTSTGDDLADQLLHELQGAPSGLTRNEMRDRLGRNRSSEEVGQALKVLGRLGLARLAPPAAVGARGAGRPPERWLAMSNRGYAENAEGPRTGDHMPISTPNRGFSPAGKGGL